LKKYWKQCKCLNSEVWRMKKVLIYIILVFFIISPVITFCVPKKNIILYFSKYTDTDIYLQPVKREIIGNNLYEIAIEELIKGPLDSSEGNAVLPNTTKVLSIAKRSDVLIINFSKEIILDDNQICVTKTNENWLSVAVEHVAIYAIANTLTGFPEVKEVRIIIAGQNSGIINGKEIENFWGHSNIKKGFTRNENLIRQ
jgi:spore germination protein GerM